MCTLNEDVFPLRVDLFQGLMCHSTGWEEGEGGREGGRGRERERVEEEGRWRRKGGGYIIKGGESGRQDKEGDQETTSQKRDREMIWFNSRSKMAALASSRSVVRR